MNLLKPLFATLLLCFFCCLNSRAQTVKTYDAAWKKIDSLIQKKNLPRTALAEVKKLYALAKKENQPAQVVKALVYQVQLQQETREENEATAIKEIETEIKTAPEPERSILNSLEASLYEQYLQQNRWKLYNRTTTVGFVKDDMATWTLEDFHQQIAALYLQSIRQATLLQQTSLASFDAIINKGNVRYLRPTLYDLLAQKALQYFKNDERDVSRPAYAFEIDQPVALAPAEEFIHAKFSTADTASLRYKALLLYQDLIRFHLEDAKPDALLDVDIDRIQFVQNNAVFPNKEEQYTQALEALIRKYNNNAAVTQASYLLALYHQNKAAQYDPLGDTTNRYESVVAKKILEKVVQDSSVQNEGWANSFNLLQQIIRPSFSFEVEKVNLPSQPFRALVQYKNTEVLTFKIISADAIPEASQRQLNDKYWDAIAAANPLKTWQQNLPATNDYQQHRVEIKIDALPVGKYILVASMPSSANKKNMAVGAQGFSVSAISYVGQGNQFFVLQRETGQPLVKASVAAYQQQYDYKTYQYNKIKVGNYTTDKNGYFQVKEAQTLNNELLFDIRYNSDRLFLDEPFYHYYRTDADEDDNDTATKKIFFFTDRSIYRPGQTVYFKGVVVAASKTPAIATNYSIKIFLEDANNEDVDSMNVHTNEFGSFSGKFVLPQNTLNGSFRIYDDEDDNEVSFSVEEYKRPKFYTEFQKIKEAYKVGDSIHVVGTAKAYAGNNIDGASVVYRVVRQPRFIYNFFWRWLPRTVSQEISHGTTQTDAEGNFNITFKALPDLSIDPKLNPFFDYRIYADVTDKNGETRSGEELITAGYQSLLMKVTVNQREAVDSFHAISIRTENSNGNFQSARVKVAVYPLLPEQRLVRKRYWQQPDQFVWSKEEFLRFFSHDEYRNETDFKTWQKGAAVYQKEDTTTANASFALPEVELTPGFYFIEITTQDKDGNEIKDSRYVELFSEGKNNFSKPEYLWAANESKAIEPGEKTTIQLGSTAADVFLVQQTTKKNEAKKETATFNFITLNNEKKVFEFGASEADRGGYGVNFFFVKDNRLYTYTDLINVPWTNKQLDISYTTFRDKTLPGSEEKWSVKISGYKNEKVAAEMLASMYDASLDQFKMHQWSVPEVWSYMRLNLPQWTGSMNFTKVVSEERWLDNRVYKYFQKVYDQLLTVQNLAVQRYMKYSAPAMSRAQDLNEIFTDSTGVRRALAGSVAGISIRGASSFANQNNALIVIDGVPASSMNGINPSDIISTSVLKGEDATNIYGAAAANGVIIITTKNGTPKIPDIQIRKNFNETAFFFPDLRTDADGNIQFSFTTPEALTRWKLQTLAHTKDLAFGLTSKELVTQKDLMVQPSPPRFLRQGDRMEFSVKIANVSDKELTGQVQLELVDAATNQSVDGWFQNVFPNQYFTVAAGSSEAVKFPIEVPYLFNSTLKWRVTARAGNVSDGEEALLPVLSNKILVTETLPLPMHGSGTKQFTFQKLLDSKNSETLQHQSLTVEYTTNPAWYAVQALPYLMEFPYECAEQTWNRYYANALATTIIKASPRIKQIFEQWKTLDTAALLSNLQKNKELKSVLLQETPWVLQAKTESEQKKNIAILFDAVRMSNELKENAGKLKEMQSENGGFVWFKGGPDDRYITQYILTGLGHLRQLHALENEQDWKQVVQKALQYADKKIAADYEALIKNKTDLKQQNIGYLQVQYLYLRSFFPDYATAKETQTAATYYRQQAQQFWMKQNKYAQGMIALSLNRTGDAKTPKLIINSLKETAINNPEQGMYWKENSFGRSWFWHQAPIETQALLIEAFSEIDNNNLVVDNLRTWLLKNKQTNNWGTTKATAEACYALLLRGTTWLSNEPNVQIKLGTKTINSIDEKTESGTGYFKQTVAGNFVQPEMGNISVTVTPKNTGTATTTWGAVYWQYFEDMDKITPAATPLQLSKKLFMETLGDKGPVLTPVDETTTLQVGNKIKVRIELRVDRDMEYVHMKDLRASALEPVNVLSGYKWQGGLGYYESTKDASTDFFFSYLRKGTYVFEYPLFVTHAGTFSNGITNIQCMYAPEFSAHSEGVKIKVE